MLYSVWSCGLTKFVHVFAILLPRCSCSRLALYQAHHYAVAAVHYDLNRLQLPWEQSINSIVIGYCSISKQFLVMPLSIAISLASTSVASRLLLLLWIMLTQY